MTPLFVAQTFTPSTTAVAGNVFLTAVVGLLPLAVFFVLMGVFKVATHWCSIIALVLSLVIAIFAFQMPIGMALLAGTQGAAMGFMPIIYIIIAAVWLYNLTEKSGRSADLKAVFNTIGRGDQRAQALIVAFCFCGLLEGLAGFGAPVAITCAMLVTLGVPKIKAAVVTVVGNAINVGFGAMAIPTTTAGRLGGADATAVAANMGHLTWIFCLFIPLLLLFILDGGRGVRQLWPLALVAGAAAGVGHFVTPSVSYELTAVVASLLGFAACYVFLLVWGPTTPQDCATSADESDKPSGSRIALALMPYVLVVVIIAITKLWRIGVSLPDLLKSTDRDIPWPGIYGSLLGADGQPSTAAIYTLQILSNPGTWIFVTGIIVAIVYGSNSSGGRFATSVPQMFAVLPRTIYSLRMAILTIASVMALAFVMNLSGQTTSIGAALATTGAAFAFLSPILGWIGTAVAGSATSAGALFANLQSTAATGAGLDPRILLAANTIGGGIGKIVSPQNLAIAATSVDSEGSDAEILKKAAPYSIGLLLVLCILVFVSSQGWLGAYMPH
ncbi:L-lactate permease [Schaalia meyeri]|uniref:L-lactate permease n=1 Tax=Schaalia meyeri TaxID=52773 RepID=UPI000682FD64|nr:lactate permease LctP family transporter [Schaalia meyeri]AKU65161.1 L-lactate permease [Schaalia meyeri]OFQ21595.1 L-lactate permease [Actinomyces sp. HMSC062G12]